MAEIDQRRTDLGEIRKQVDAWEAVPFPEGPDKEKLDSLRYLEACAEVNVITALREWWAQGCREVDPIKALLSDALTHLVEHDNEYHHQTPPELLARLRAATSHG